MPRWRDYAQRERRFGGVTTAPTLRARQAA